MFSLYGQNGQVAHGIREFICDTKDDVKDLPVNVSPGSDEVLNELLLN